MTTFFKTTILLTLLFSSELLAMTSTGVYEVPREDGQIVNYQSVIEFDGSDISEAEEITVTFPVQLVGVKNQFVIKKIDDNTWEGSDQLFDEVQCHKGMSFDFECRLDFREDSVVDSSNQEDLTVNDDQEILFVNRELAIESLTAASLSSSEIDNHLVSTDQFMSEPIGFFKYRNIWYTGP